ncbi:hypothetical protein KOI35_40420 [Actinoplanes bogorensis]|uniref:NACHT domain-containing protein n=1 Tax=Paractinoplanes bogorensis TaxID=1610840 RepID=A0ABS5Z278_9ACTN|nr:hypothetical protein [Actinoplanes bogorensis]MBU2669793.1 hypothetical protein [Actinoplanes bogorensis]
MLIIALEVWDRLGGRDSATVTGRPDDPRNIRRALQQVSRYVQARQAGLLAERIRLTLGERPDAVRQPMHMVQRVSGAEFQLSDDAGILDVFDDMDESMLILGAPGAGKTTQLLDLAAALVGRAEQQTADGGPAGMPVLLDLVGWSRPRRSLLDRLSRSDPAPPRLATWIEHELQERYRIPATVSRAWLREGRMILLLDGLDEVPDAYRERCVTEINGLDAPDRSSRIVVCSREADYDRLTSRLSLQGAVVIRPLTEAQVTAYLSMVSPRLAGVAAVLSADDDLWELLTTPLMLSVLVLAQDNEDWQVLLHGRSRSEQRRLIFDSYVVEMMARRREREVEGPVHAVRAIRTLALVTIELDYGVIVRSLRSGTLRTSACRPIVDAARMWIAPVSCVCVAAVGVAGAWRFGSSVRGVAFLAMLLAAMAVMPRWRRAGRLRHARTLVTGCLGAVVAAVATSTIVLVALAALVRMPFGPAGIVTAPLIVAFIARGVWFPHREASEAWCRRLLVVGVVGSGLALVFVQIQGQSGADRLLAGISLLSGILSLATVLGIAMPVGFHLDPYTRNRTTGRLWRTLEFVLMLLLAPAYGFLLVDPVADTEPRSPVTLVAASLFLVFCAGASIAAVLWPLVVVLSFRAAGEPNPWRQSYLRFAADRSLLVRTADGYRFVHLLIRDHLAHSDPEVLGAAVIRRRAELTGA